MKCLISLFVLINICIGCVSLQAQVPSSQADKTATSKPMATAEANSSSVKPSIHAEAREVFYHTKDIVYLNARMKFTTLIVLPVTEKIMEAASGDKEFWVVDVVNNFCFIHPAKEGASTNLNLITDKGNIYSFVISDITGSGLDADLKVIVTPVEQSNFVASSGSPQYVPQSQLEQMRQQLTVAQNRVNSAVDEYKSIYPLRLTFDYQVTLNSAPFNIQAIYHDDHFTYIKTSALEKFAVYEMRDGSPNLVNYDVKEGTYVISKVMENGYVELGKKRLYFTKKG